jgi:hypothetical protein
MRKRREAPVRRTNPSGKEVWIARYTNRLGQRKSAGTYSRKHEAQDAIDAAYGAQERGFPETLGAYAESWTKRHPRAKRTNTTNDSRLSLGQCLRLSSKAAHWANGQCENSAAAALTR